MTEKKYLVQMAIVDSYHTITDRIFIAEDEKDMKREVERYYRDNWDEPFAECLVFEIGNEVDISSFVEKVVSQKEKEEEELEARRKAEVNDRERKEFERLKKKFEG